MYSISNTIIIAIIISVVCIIIFFIFKKDMELQEENVVVDPYSLLYLKDNIRNLFHEITNQNVAQLYLNKNETRKRELQKTRLNNALRSCAHGNIGEKEFVKDYIKDLLQGCLSVNENTIDLVIPFHQSYKLTTQDKFEILLYLMKKEFRTEAFEKLSNLCKFDMPKQNSEGTYYEITKEDIDRAFTDHRRTLNFIDKLEIVTQRIYQEVFGFSVADELRDMKIDGISGGVSGISNNIYNYMEEVIISGEINKMKTYDSLWIFFRGKAIHLSCLSFGSQAELIRVCKNLYRNNNVGHLTSSNGYKLIYLHDSSRVVVVRPKLSSHWAFFVRKFDSANSMTLHELIKDKGNDQVIDLIRWIIKGCLNVVISGDQNSGKTTALKAFVQFIDQRYPIRTTEQEFELWLNNTYPCRNIACFRSSDEVDIIESINIQKKTDGAVMILGEVASLELANAFITLTQAGTKATLCTNHCVSTEDLVDYFRNAILSSGMFSHEMIAEEQVSNSIHIDIHWEKTGDGHRYISHITEIIPYPRDEVWPEDNNECLLECFKRMARKRAFYTNQLIVYEHGLYRVKNPLSKRLINKIIKNLSYEDQLDFMAYQQQYRSEHG